MIKFATAITLGLSLLAGSALAAEEAAAKAAAKPSKPEKGKKGKHDTNGGEA